MHKRPIRNRYVVVAGMILLILSMTSATQFATTKLGYSYSIVHPSNADIRLIGSDTGNDGRILRVDGDNSTGEKTLTISLGNISLSQNLTYTAAVGIVNEEIFSVNITHINISASSGDYDYLQIWLHSDRDQRVENDSSSVFVWENGTMKNSSDTTAWVLGPGNQNPNDMSADGSTQISTPWDETKHVRYSTNNSNNSISGTSDFVWVQISIDVPDNADTSQNFDGLIYIHTKSSTN